MSQEQLFIFFFVRGVLLGAVLVLGILILGMWIGWRMSQGLPPVQITRSKVRVTGGEKPPEPINQEKL